MSFRHTLGAAAAASAILLFPAFTGHASGDSGGTHPDEALSVVGAVVSPAPADTSATEEDDGRPRGLVRPERRLLVPVAGVRRADLVDSYREARGQGRRHRAIDIHAPRGTPVLAAADGTVVRLFESVPGGTTLYKLDPDERTIYYYAHLDGYAPGIAEGQGISRGDTIGFVGDTGNAQPGDYHLHFSVSTTEDPARWWGGTPTNPYPLLRAYPGPE